MATALINGDAETGVTIFKMDEKVDHGPIICQEKYRILLTDKRPDLEIKLTDIAFKIFKKMIRNVILSEERSDESKDPLTIKLTPQNHSLATYTKKLLKQDGFIPFENLKLALSEVEGLKIYNLYRGLYPWPGLWTLIQPARPTRSNAAGQKRLKITDLDFIDERLIIKKVKLEGKKEVDFKTFNQAYQIF